MTRINDIDKLVEILEIKVDENKTFDEIYDQCLEEVRKFKTSHKMVTQVLEDSRRFRLFDANLINIEKLT